MVKNRPKRSANPEHSLYFSTSIPSPDIKLIPANAIVRIGNGVQFMFAVYVSIFNWHENSWSPRVIFIFSIAETALTTGLFGRICYPRVKRSWNWQTQNRNGLFEIYVISSLTSRKWNNINCDSFYGHNPYTSDLLIDLSKILSSLQFLNVQGNRVTKQIKFFILSEILLPS